MANNWDKMSRDDYNAIRQNKFNYHNTNDPALREIYHNNNSKISHVVPALLFAFALKYASS